MIKKNIHKLMQKEFAFLLDDGFQIEKYQQGADLEVVYTKDGISVVAWYYEGINNCYEKIDTFDVMLKKENDRKRLLQCDHLFNKENLQQLENELKNLKIKDQIHLYALFLQDNVQSLK